MRFSVVPMPGWWKRSIGLPALCLLWSLVMFPDVGFAETDAELRQQIDRFLGKDEKRMEELKPLPPRAVVVMTGMLKDLPEWGPHSVLFKALGLKVEQHEAVLSEAELRDALKVLVEKRPSGNRAIQDSNDIVLRRISSKERIKNQLVELGASEFLKVPEKPVSDEDSGETAIPVTTFLAMAGVILAGGIVIGVGRHRAKAARRGLETVKI